MSVLIVVENARIAAAMSSYASIRAERPDISIDLDVGKRLATFRHYATVICDVSFSGATCTAGLEVAHAAKRRDRRTRTVVLATSLSPAIEQARLRGDVDIVLLKPQPLASVFAHARDAETRETFPELSSPHEHGDVVDLHAQRRAVTLAWNLQPATPTCSEPSSPR